MEIVKSVFYSGSFVFVALSLVCWALYFIRREEAIIENGQVKIVSWKPFGIAATITALMCIIGWVFFARLGL